MKLLLLSLALFGSAFASLRAGDGQWSKKRDAAYPPEVYVDSTNTGGGSSQNTIQYNKREAANSPSAYGSSSSNAESSSNTNYKKRQTDCEVCMSSSGSQQIPHICDEICARKRKAPGPQFFPKMPKLEVESMRGNSGSSQNNIQMGKREAATSPTDEDCIECIKSGWGAVIPSCSHACDNRKREAVMPPGFPEMPKFPDMPEFPSYPNNGNSNSNSAGSHNNVPPGSVVHSTNTVNGKKREAEGFHSSCKCNTKCYPHQCIDVCKRCDDSGCTNVSSCNGKREAEYLERLRRSIEQRR